MEHYNALSWFALFMLSLVSITFVYAILYIHDIPSEMAKKRNHPHDENHLLKRKEYLEVVVGKNFKAYELTKKQYEIGQGSLLNVLQVQQRWISAKIAKLDKTLINRVNIYSALGGSFKEVK